MDDGGSSVRSDNDVMTKSRRRGERSAGCFDTEGTRGGEAERDLRGKGCG